MFVWLIIWRLNLRHSPNTHAFFYVSWCHWICQVHNKFSKLFHINNILWIIRISIDDFCTSCHLKKSKYCVYMANWYNNLLHITTQVHSFSSLATELINLDARDIMSKYDLPAKTNTKIQCVCFLWVWNFVGNSMGIFDPWQLTNYPRSKQDVSQFLTPSHSMHQVTWANNLCTVAHNVCWSSLWTLLHVTHLAPRILRLGFPPGFRDIKLRKLIEADGSMVVIMRGERCSTHKGERQRSWAALDIQRRQEKLLGD